MLQIGKTIISLDVIQKKFCCDLEKCKGGCCVDGDSGAPITEEEAEQIEQMYPYFEEYLSIQNRDEILKQGFSITDFEGDLVTPIIGKNECVYTFVDWAGITKCAIEKAWFEKRIAFRKPVSCHLFPIRISEYKRFDAVNYQELDICKAGQLCGEKHEIPLWKYLKEPLIRKYGQAWYDEFTITAENIPKDLRD